MKRAILFTKLNGFIVECIIMKYYRQSPLSIRHARALASLDGAIMRMKLRSKNISIKQFKEEMRNGTSKNVC